jgi:HK97 family phage major capsid protein
MTILQDMRERERGINAEIRAINEKVEDEGRDKLLASETRKYAALRTERTGVEARIAQLEQIDERSAAFARGRTELFGPGGGNGGGFGNDADTIYGRNSGQSYFRDLIAVAQPGDASAFEAANRLREHAVVVERAQSDLPREFRAGPHKRAGGTETRVNPNRTDGQGGFGVPPLWLMDEYVALLRAGRSTANRCHQLDLPPGTDSINIPKLATGTTTAVQTADAAAVSSTDLTDTSLVGPVRTIAGQQDIAQQLLDQSPISFDEIILKDLLSDYNQKLDIQVLSGSGAAGQVSGIFGAPPATVTYTDAAPTLPKLWPILTQSLSVVARTRFQSADSIVVTPQRWWWMVSQLDTAGRPLIASSGAGFNAMAVFDANAVEGVAGSIGGVPVVVDANSPSNFGAGVNQDRILVGKLQDVYLWEGALRTRVMTEVLSGTLQVRVQLFSYLALIANRYTAALSMVDGTGLISPAGF